jgi:vacuolar protein sorting-associated protein 54
VDSAVRDLPELLLTTETLHEPSSPVPSPPSIANGTVSVPAPPVLPSPSSPRRTKQNGSSAPSTKHIRIEDKAYYTVSATSEVLALLLDYLKIIMNLSTLTIDTMSRVIEFLKAFNSRTCQVVLGAGARLSAGLKNITAKHLGAYHNRI